MRSCTNIVDPDQTLHLIRIYTVSHLFSNTLDISIVSKIIKIIECMHAYIHACIHTCIYSCMAGTHEPTYLPTYRPTYAVRACMRVWMYASVHVMLFVLYICVHFHLCPEQAAHLRNLIRVQCAHLRTLIGSILFVQDIRVLL